MKIEHHIPLATLTSLEVGGPADTLVTIESSDEILPALEAHAEKPLWFLGYGTNSLVADSGLRGTAFLLRNTSLQHQDTLVIADAGAWWDDLVQYAISLRLFGLELMSGIPGGVGAAVVGNIAAYGQAVSSTLAWIEVIDTATHELRRIAAQDLAFDYRYSNLQEASNEHLLVVRAAFQLSRNATTELHYQAALDVATQKGYDTSTLDGRRSAIMDARASAGSLWDYRDASHASRTAGSFFRNPLVTPRQAEQLIAFDESGRTAEQIQKMNQIHGGSSMRVSAAHVLLAAGFYRGQQWGNVRLHPDHVLKTESLDGAEAQEIYDVTQLIIKTVKEKLGIDLTPEVRFLGEFRQS